jgi:hypothetical protein
MQVELKEDDLDKSNPDEQHTHHLASRGARSIWAFWGFVAVAAFFLLTEHRAHLFGILPFLLLLACPLMHLFHHGGHGAHERDGAEGERE